MKLKKIAAVDVSTLSKREIFISLILIGTLFFVFGFVSWVNAILIPYFKIACELTHFESYLVAFAFYIAYLVMSVPSSYLIKKIGFKKGIMLGFWIMAIGTFLFIPAAYVRTYSVFLTGLFIIGIGLAILQTAANPYITVLGPRESAARRISVMGVFNKGAGIIAPILLAAVILRPDDGENFKNLSLLTPEAKDVLLDGLIRRVILPYSVLTGILVILGIIVHFSPLPEIDTETEKGDVLAANAHKKSIFEFPYLILGALAIFLHVGTQVIAVDTIIGYADSMGIGLTQAKVFPSFVLFTTICGYFMGILLIPKYISQLNVLRICTFLGLLFSLLILFLNGNVTLFGFDTHISIWFVVLLGLANSLIWAGIWPLALHGLGRFTKLGASILIMGLCGNAILPLIYGKIADLYSVRVAYIVLIPCYLYLIFYAVKGYQITKWKIAKSL
ncbi:MAG: sugar MFS transporter [Ginsengibacter sp.]